MAGRAFATATMACAICSTVIERYRAGVRDEDSSSSFSNSHGVCFYPRIMAGRKMLTTARPCARSAGAGERGVRIGTSGRHERELMPRPDARSARAKAALSSTSTARCSSSLMLAAGLYCSHAD